MAGLAEAGVQLLVNAAALIFGDDAIYGASGGDIVEETRHPASQDVDEGEAHASTPSPLDVAPHEPSSVEPELTEHQKRALKSARDEPESHRKT